MDALPPDEPAGTDIVDLWLGLITAVVLGGAGVMAASLAYLAPELIGAWGPLASAVGLALLVATPLAAAWATRRPDWQGAGLRAVGVGVVAVLLAVPLVHGAARLLGLTVSVPAILLTATAGIGASVATAAPPTHRWSLLARGLAVLVVLLAPLAVIAAGDLLGPQPAAVARSLWTAAPLGVLPVIGVADSIGHALAGRSARHGEAERE